MALIFFLSGQSNLATDLGAIDLILRKIAHMVEYGLLWFLWWRALGYGDRLPAVLIALGYAMTDELHQGFVDGRHGTPVDVFIDTIGIAIALRLSVLKTRARPTSRARRAAGEQDRHGRAGESAPALPPARL
jgi:VanZ family protein